MSARLSRRYREAPWYQYTPQAGLVSIDLGKRKVGIAVFDDLGTLCAAQTVHTQRDTKEWDPWITADAVLDTVTEHIVLAGLTTPFDWVCEWPELREKDRNNHHNITALQQVGIYIERSQPWRERYRPSEWKRQVAKELHHRRLKECLSEMELDIWTSLGHDARDAVGIGLFAMGRVDSIGRPL